jgi:hypothetical protein
MVQKSVQLYYFCHKFGLDILSTLTIVNHTNSEGCFTQSLKIPFFFHN